MRYSTVGVQLAFCALLFFVSDVASSGNSGNKYGIPEDSLKRLKSAFLKAGQGKPLSKEPLREALRLTHLTGRIYSDDELATILNKVGKDCDGTLDEAEFLNLMSIILNERDPEESIKSAFRVCDRHGKGKVDGKDIRKTLHKLLKEKVPVSYVKVLMKVYDEDRDGCLNYQEFKNAFGAKLTEGYGRGAGDATSSADDAAADSSSSSHETSQSTRSEVN